MGRPRHEIISEYYVRGRKLPNASNRYVQTCKKCDEEFPKGRVDALLNHLIRKCPRLTEYERHMIYQALQRQEQEQELRRQEQQRLETTSQVESPPIHPEPTALDTLAEVSRQHLDYSAYRDPSPESTDAHYDGAAELELLAHLQAATQQIGMENAAAAVATNTQTHATTSAEPLPLVAYSIPDETRPSRSDTLLAQVQTPPPHTAPTNEQAPVAAVESTSEHNDTDVSEQSHPSPEEYTAASGISSRSATNDIMDDTASIQQVAGTAQNMAWNPTNVSGMASFGSLTANIDLTAGFGLLQSPPREKKRNQFGLSRRKEVSQIRKLRACLRCRMLKKSCSEGTPCVSCAGVESARLWKGKCLRTRLADEFRLWSTGLFHSRASLMVPSAVHGLQGVSMEGRIEIRLFSFSELFMTFTAVRYSSQLVDYEALPDVERPGSTARDTLWLLDDGKGTLEKIENYIGAVTETCIAHEHDPFVKATLGRAQEMTKVEAPDKGLSSDTIAPKRSCYNVQENKVLKDTIELWVATSVLANHRKHQVRLRYDSARQPGAKPGFAQNVGNGGRVVAPDLAVSSRNQELIITQILAAVESRCRDLSTSVLNELEKRLLQRQGVSQFTTFLASIILLNTIERMTGTYRSFDTSTSGVEAENQDGDTRRPLDWPLDSPPSKLWPQGECFADLIIMLSRIRALPPKTVTTLAGKLIVQQDYVMPTKVSGRPVKEQTAEQTTLPASWLDPMELDAVKLAGIRDSPLPLPSDDIEAWDLKFVTRALLPGSKAASSQD